MRQADIAIISADLHPLGRLSQISPALSHPTGNLLQLLTIGPVPATNQFHATIPILCSTSTAPLTEMKIEERTKIYIHLLVQIKIWDTLDKSLQSR